MVGKIAGCAVCGVKWCVVGLEFGQYGRRGMYLGVAESGLVWLYNVVSVVLAIMDEVGSM